MTLDFSRFNFTIFLTEAVFYIAAFAVGVASVLRIDQIISAQQEIARRAASLLPGSSLDLPADLISYQNLNSPEIITIGQFLISFLVATAFFLILLKTKHGGTLFKILFILAVFAGSQVVLRIWFPPGLAIMLALILTASRFIFPVVIVHNFAIITAITGIAVNLGINIDPSAAILILIVIAIYDFIAVYITGHMVKMFKSTVALGTIFAMIVPLSIRSMLKPLSQVNSPGVESNNPQKQFVYLGGGDLAFPLIFVVSIAARMSIASAIYAALGAIIGLLVLNLMFMAQKERRPMAGMPPLAAFSILGFLVSLI